MPNIEIEIEVKGDRYTNQGHPKYFIVIYVHGFRKPLIIFSCIIQSAAILVHIFASRFPLYHRIDTTELYGRFDEYHNQ